MTLDEIDAKVNILCRVTNANGHFAYFRMSEILAMSVDKPMPYSDSPIEPVAFPLLYQGEPITLVVATNEMAEIALGCPR